MSINRVIADLPLEEIVGKNLKRLNKTISVAESCTGGLLANRITDIPGSSAYFRMGIVAYSNDSKNKVLGVPLGVIKKYGAVSKHVTSLMAKGVKKLAGADIGVGISGIAGPGGATKNRPVGVVYIALSYGRKNICKKYLFGGERKVIKQKATQKALDLIRELCL